MSNSASSFTASHAWFYRDNDSDFPSYSPSYGDDDQGIAMAGGTLMMAHSIIHNFGQAVVHTGSENVSITQSVIGGGCNGAIDVEGSTQTTFSGNTLWSYAHRSLFQSGHGLTAPYGVHVVGSASAGAAVTIASNTISAFTDQGNAMNKVAWVEPHAGKATVDNNSLYAFKNAGAYIASASANQGTLQVENNYVQSGIYTATDAPTGIYINNQVDAYLLNNAVHYIVSGTPGAKGLDIQNSSGTSIVMQAGYTLSNCAIGVDADAADYLNIVAPQIPDATSTGIHIADSSDPLVHGGTISAPLGIHLENVTGFKVYRNSISSSASGAVGVKAEGSSSSETYAMVCNTITMTGSNSTGIEDNPASTSSAGFVVNNQSASPRANKIVVPNTTGSYHLKQDVTGVTLYARYNWFSFNGQTNGFAATVSGPVNANPPVSTSVWSDTNMSGCPSN